MPTVNPYTSTEYELLQAVIKGEYEGSWNALAARLTAGGYAPEDVQAILEKAGCKSIKNYAGEVVSYEIPSTVQSTVYESVGMDSNTTALARGRVNGCVSIVPSQQTGKSVASTLRGAGTKTITAISKVAEPVALATAGMWLGAQIDSSLYNLAPDFWDSVGAGSLNPETWAKSFFPDNELGQAVTNMLFGIDPNTGETQAYMDADTLAYLAYCLNNAGVFNQASGWTIDTTQATFLTELRANNWVLPAVGGSFTYWDNQSYLQPPGDTTYIRYRVTESTSPVYCLTWGWPSKYVPYVLWCSKDPFIVKYEIVRFSDGVVTYTLDYGGNISYIDNNNPFYYSSQDSTAGRQIAETYGINRANVGRVRIPQEIAYVILFGTAQTTIPGIEPQQGATYPDFRDMPLSDYPEYLQQQYPDSYANAINYPVMQPDGSVINHTYVPVPLPQFFNWSDTQPVTSTSTQLNPELDPQTIPQELLDALTKALQQPAPKSKTDADTGYADPPIEPTETGGGSSPVPVAPTGEASALWSVYHPTQAQVDSFGAWLWSSNFVDQLLKVFNNPMESIIGLHKIYATPVDAGASTIVVGYLDSQVPSQTVAQQYVTVDCGSVNCDEYFGSVFDYPPYTEVKLYLPFVGIVSLDVADVMRSTISVEYGVDVLTGACLAMVNVSRDGGGGVLYQYAGNCAVQYPISSGSYMGIVSGLLSVAGGIAATVATGGGAAPIALGIAGGAMSAHTTVQNSGSFAGNAGAMGGKIPYLIISRPQPKVADDFSHMQGYPTNQSVYVGDCSGYIVASEVHSLSCEGATSEELTEIETLLKEGVVI